MLKLFLIINIILVFSGCQNKQDKQFATAKHDFQAYIRWGNRFFYIYVDRNGEGGVEKGKSLGDVGPIEIQSSDTSEPFKLDSISTFFAIAADMKKNPTINSDFSTDSPTAELYLDEKKIYYSRRWNHSF